MRRRVLLAAAHLAALPLFALTRRQAIAAPRSAPQTRPPGAEAYGPRSGAAIVGVISGGVDGTYIRIAADLAAVLDDPGRLRVLPILGKGSVQNIDDLMHVRGVDIGIVQSDVLAYVKRQQLLPGSERQVTYIAKLYDEEVHVLARQEVGSLADLAGKRVNMDVRGSGTALTAAVLFDGLSIPIEATYDDQATALEKLRHGQITALTYVTGKPARLFSGVGADSGLHLLSVPMRPALLETYLPSRFDHADYPALVPDGAPVETIAVGAVMAAYAWPPGSERYRWVARFVDTFFDDFPRFRQPPHHPKWREVSLGAQVPGWTQFSAAQEWLRRQTPPAAAGSG